MEIQPLVSIVMPIRNAAEWVGETIQSVLSQDYTNWELIVVDDFSEDESPSIVESFAKLDMRISQYCNKSKGIIGALNLAFENATGSYVTRMDADDIMPPNRLLLMVSHMKVAKPKTVVTGYVHYFSDQQVSDGYVKYEKWLNDRVDAGDHYQHIYRECVVASPNWIVSLKEMRDAKIVENLQYPEDYDMCFQWQKLGFVIEGVKSNTLHWREHPRRTSRNSDRYQQPAFFALKLRWFMHNFSSIKSVGIVGWGQKGKECGRVFQAENFPFNCYDLEASRFNTPQFGKEILSIDHIDDEVVLLARYPNDLSAVQKFIESKGYTIGVNAFWV